MIKLKRKISRKTKIKLCKPTLAFQAYDLGY